MFLTLTDTVRKPFSELTGEISHDITDEPITELICCLSSDVTLSIIDGLLPFLLYVDRFFWAGICQLH